jgi:Rrf2 family protein
LLSTTTEYALRALAHLASATGGEPVLGRDLAQAADIPVDYLSKIMLALRNAGLVSAARGTHGGYRLVVPAAQIRLLNVVEVFEGISARPHCFLGGRDCDEHEPCSAHRAWRNVRDMYLHFLTHTTLEEIARGTLRRSDPYLPKRRPR